MDGHLVPASSNSKIRCSLENFTLDAERWLASLYWCVRTSYGDDAAHAAADCWLQVFEERLRRIKRPSRTDKNHCGSNRSLRIKSSSSRY
jgi:hypothetical protein